MNRGLEATKGLKDWGDDGSAGKLDLGISATTATGARAFLDVSHRLTRSWGQMSAFATAYAGMSKATGRWRTDAGAVAGLRVEW